MAKGKSLLAKMYAAHQKAKEQQRRAEERAEQARLKQEQQTERARQQAAAQQEKERRTQAAAQLREQQRQQAEAKREQQRQAVENRQLAVQRRLVEAEFRTEAVRAQVAGLERLLQDRNRSLAASRRRIEDVFNTQGSEPFVAALQEALATSIYPDNMRGSCAAMYRPEARELLVEYELPRQDVVPTAVAYRYVKSKDLVQPEPRKEAEIKKLISTHATRDAFTEIVLDEPALDPVACLRGYLNAVVSPHPYDFEAVRPVVQFDLSQYKFVEEMDVLAGFDSRPDLLALKPVEFEHLIRQLFEGIGLKSWVTQVSRDDGVDAVAVNEDPIMGGLCVIQAKRYSGIVGLEAVHALAGVMEDKSATKGILVTTSWVGKASRDFAARNGRIDIIEGRHLKDMLLEHLHLDALIGLPKLPPGWEQSYERRRRSVGRPRVEVTASTEVRAAPARRDGERAFHRG